MSLIKELDIDSYYNKKIEERAVLVKNLNTLKNKIHNARSTLSYILDNLRLGLTIEENALGSGKLSEYSEEYLNYISIIDSLILSATDEISSLSIEYENAKAEARKKAALEEMNEIQNKKEKSYKNKTNLLNGKLVNSETR